MMSRIDFGATEKRSKQDPRENLLEIVAKVIPEVCPGSERGEDKRHAVAIIVPAVAVDEDYRPVAEPTRMLTRDLSASGIGLVHTKPAGERLLALELPSPTGPVQIVVEVVRCRQIGSFYDIGGRFVARLT